MMKLGRFFQFALLLLVAAGAQPAYSAFWQWSKTASSNASADPSINWAEGMSPSSVNDSARAMMARAAEYRDDISGLLVLGGTGSAYTASTNQGLAATPNNGQMIAFLVSQTNNANATITLDGGNTYPIHIAQGTPAPAGTLVSGSPYRVTFIGGGLNAWVLFGVYGNPYNTPLGALMPFTGTVAPNSNFIFAAGQCISTSTYAQYWALLGSPGSGSCGGGQFRVIDMRGNVPAGLDTMPGSGAANRLTASGTGCGTAMTTVGAECANGSQSVALTTGQIPAGISVSASGSASVTSTVQVLTGSGHDNYNSVAGSCCVPNQSLVTVTSTGSASVSGTANGGGAAHPVVQPTAGVTYLLRVL